MQTFTYIIRDALGIHARPAGMLVKEAKKYDSKITISANGKDIDAGKLMMLMRLGVKQGTEITVTVEGPDEEQAAAGMKAFLEESL